MDFTQKQAELVELTMELDLKAKEYNMLCMELDELKKKNIDENDEQYILLREKFAKNLEEIQNINQKLKDL